MLLTFSLCVVFVEIFKIYDFSGMTIYGCVPSLETHCMCFILFRILQDVIRIVQNSLVT